MLNDVNNRALVASVTNFSAWAAIHWGVLRSFLSTIILIGSAILTVWAIVDKVRNSECWKQWRRKRRRQ